MKEDKYKLSIRFYNDREVRAVWNEEKGVWFFSVLDVIGAINGQDDYAKTRNYWKYLKAKIKKENRQEKLEDIRRALPKNVRDILASMQKSKLRN